jgi:hypothetical protein
MADVILYKNRSGRIPFKLSGEIADGSTLRFSAAFNPTAPPILTIENIDYDPSNLFGYINLVDADTQQLPLGVLSIDLQANYGVGENYVVAVGTAEVRSPVRDI